MFFLHDVCLYGRFELWFKKFGVASAGWEKELFSEACQDVPRCRKVRVFLLDFGTVEKVYAHIAQQDDTSFSRQHWASG